MKKYKYLSYVFMALAVLMSDVMCAAVAYQYCDMQRHMCYSAPASVVFLFVIPYAVGIAVCAVLAWIFHRRYGKVMRSTKE